MTEITTVTFIERGERFTGEFLGWTDDGWATVFVTDAPDVDWAKEFKGQRWDATPDVLVPQCECGNAFRLCHPEA